MNQLSLFQGVAIILVQVTLVTLVGTIPLLILIPRLIKVESRLRIHTILAAIIIVPSYVWLIANQWKGDALIYSRIYALQFIVIGLVFVIRGLRWRYQSIIHPLALAAIATLFIWHIITTNRMEIIMTTDVPALQRPAQLVLAGWEMVLLVLSACISRLHRRGDT